MNLYDWTQRIVWACIEKIWIHTFLTFQGGLPYVESPVKEHEIRSPFFPRNLCNTHHITSISACHVCAHPFVTRLLPPLHLKPNLKLITIISPFFFCPVPNKQTATETRIELDCCQFTSPLPTPPPPPPSSSFPQQREFSPISCNAQSAQP